MPMSRTTDSHRILDLSQTSNGAELLADQYATMLATTSDGFWRFDTDARLLDVNDAYCRMSGYTREELLKLTVPDLEAGESPEDVADHIRKVIGAGFDRFEAKHRRKDGTVFDVEISVSHWQTANQFLLFARDFAERKRAKQQESEHEAEIEEPCPVPRREPQPGPAAEPGRIYSLCKPARSGLPAGPPHGR